MKSFLLPRRLPGMITFWVIAFTSLLLLLLAAGVALLWFAWLQIAAGGLPATMVR